jgi:hypothetical protein
VEETIMNIAHATTTGTESDPVSETRLKVATAKTPEPEREAPASFIEIDGRRIDATDAIKIIKASWLDEGSDLIREGFAKLESDLDLLGKVAEAEVGGPLAYALFLATKRLDVLQGLVDRERKATEARICELEKPLAVAAGSALFPNLADAVRYNAAQSPSERRSWSNAAIVAAAGGAMGDEDLTTGGWVRALDAIEAALGAARKATRATKRGAPRTKARG